VVVVVLAIKETLLTDQMVVLVVVVVAHCNTAAQDFQEHQDLVLEVDRH
jgi:hypothetical protein